MFFRNPDFRELTLEQDGNVLLKFAVVNGFRNIQNLVQKMKRGKSIYHYVEVMACPSGIYSHFSIFPLELPCMNFILINSSTADVVRWQCTNWTAVKMRSRHAYDTKRA
jgi:hypothetical protein